MRIDLLMTAQEEFLYRYPMGVDDDDLKATMKKHNKHHEFARNAFAKDKFGFTEPIIEDMIRLVQRASMVAVFEKPKFRDYVRALPSGEKDTLAMALYELYYGNQEKGFEQIVEILVQGKMGRWTLISTFLYYMEPEQEVFCKPTTVKGIIKTLELEDLVYKPRPSYAFYTTFRDRIMELKGMCDPRIGKDNAALTGVLWMAMPKANR